MKPLLLSLLVLAMALRLAYAQAATDEFSQQAAHYQALAVKLYPDCAVADSPLMKMMYKVDEVMKANNSQAYYLPTKPLIEAAVAASLVKIAPRWDAVTEGEKNDAFDMVVVAMLSTHDLSPSEAHIAATPTPVPAPAQQPFNPGSMNDDVNASPSSTPVPQSGTPDPNVVPTRKGFLYFYNNLVNQGAGMTGHGKGKDEPKYKAGPLQGKTEGEGRVYAEQQWAQMSRDQQIACEQNANTYGSGPDPDAPKTSRTYYYQPNGMGGGTITGP